MLHIGICNFVIVSNSKNTDGTQIRRDHSQLLGKLLKSVSIDLSTYGVNIHQLIEGSSTHTIEELQFILAKETITRSLADTLQEKLTLSKL